MARTTLTRTINAPVETVFETIGSPHGFSKAVPHITQIEILSEETMGEGLVFRETREQGGREMSSVLEIVEYVPNEKVRFVSEAGGSVWDSIFTVEKVGESQTRLDFVMEATPQTFIARIVNPLMKGMIAKAIAADMDAVKAHCEVQAPTASE